MSGRRPRSDDLWDASYVLLVILISLLEFRGMLPDGYPPGVGGDSLGHLFKIWVVRDYLGRGDLPPPWIRWWGAGFPFLRFYPPLTYLLAGAAALILGGPSRGYRFVALAALVLGPLAMDRAARPLLRSAAASRAAGLIYGFSSWHLRMISAEGNLPMFLGFSAAPVTLLAAERILEPGADWRSVLPSAAGFGLLVLIHHTSALSAVVAVLPLAAAAAPGVVRDEGISPVAKRAAAALAIAFGVSSVWLIPAVAEAGRARFLSVRQFPGQLEFWSVNPGDVLTWPPRGYSQHLGVVLLAAPAVAAAAARRREAIVLAATGYAALIASFGSHGPLGWLFLVDPISSFPPIRLVPTFVFCASLAAVYWFPATGGGSLRRARLAALGLAALTVLSIAEAYPRTADMSVGWMPPEDYLEAVVWAASEIPPYARIYQPGLPAVEGSLPSLLPSIVRRPILGSWYAEATQIRWDLVLLDERMRLPSESAWVRRALKSYDVWAVILSDRIPLRDEVAETLSGAGFSAAWRSGEYTAWIGRGRPAEAVRGRVLAIGKSAWVVDRILQDASVDRGGSDYLDDYDPSELSGYDLVVLCGYGYRNPGRAREVLTSYLTSGGRVAVSTFGSPDQDSPNVLGLGFRSKTFSLNGTVGVSGTLAGILSPFSYEGGPWMGPLYSGPGVEPNSSIGGWTLLGRARFGPGEVLLIGGNLLYHAVYSGNGDEAAALANFMLPPPPEVEVSVSRWGDGEISLRVSSPRETAILISEAWYPRWEAQVDGSPVPTWEDGRTGLTCVRIPPGVSEVNLSFAEPWRPLYPASAASAAAALLAPLTAGGRGGSGGGRRRGRSARP